MMASSKSFGGGGFGLGATAFAGWASLTPSPFARASATSFGSALQVHEARAGMRGSERLEGALDGEALFIFAMASLHVMHLLRPLGARSRYGYALDAGLPPPPGV